MKPINQTAALDCLHTAQGRAGKRMLVADVPSGALVRLGPNLWQAVYLLEWVKERPLVYSAIWYCGEGTKLTPQMLPANRPVWLLMEPQQVVHPVLEANDVPQADPSPEGDV